MKNNYCFFGIVLLFNVCFFALMSLILPIRFESIDDVRMCMIANGLYTGITDCHLIFISAIYGSFLSFFYTICGSIEWYSVSFAALQIASMSAIVYCTLKHYKHFSKYTKALFLVVIYVFWIRFIQSFQFTVTAGLTCFAGCVLLMTNSRKNTILGITLIVLASMVRFHAAGLVGILWFPVFVYKHGFHWKSYQKIIILLAIVFTCKIGDILAYNSTQWKNFRTYNSMRSIVEDCQNSYKTRYTMSQKTGIAVEDIELFLVFCPDTKIVSIDKLRIMSQTVYGTNTKNKLNALKQLRKYLFVSSLILLFGCVLSINSNKKIIFMLITLFLIYSSIIIYYGLNFDLQNRVWMIAMLPIAFTYFLCLGETKKIKSYCNILLVIIAILFTSKYCKQIIEWKTGNDNKQITFNIEQKPLLSSLPHNSILYALPSSLYSMFVSPFHIKDIGHCEYEAWLSMSPINDNVFVSYDNLVNGKIYMYMNKTENNIYIYNHIINSLKRNYNIEVEHITIAKNKTHELFKLKKI